MHTFHTYIMHRKMVGNYVKSSWDTCWIIGIKPNENRQYVSFIVELTQNINEYDVYFVWILNHILTHVLSLNICTFIWLSCTTYVQHLNRMRCSMDTRIVRSDIEMITNITSIKCCYRFLLQFLKSINLWKHDIILFYSDPRPHRTFANIRYALYEYWLRQYTLQSYVLILDFRDTFFQGKESFRICSCKLILILLIISNEHIDLLLCEYVIHESDIYLNTFIYI